MENTGQERRRGNDRLAEKIDTQSAVIGDMAITLAVLKERITASEAHMVEKMGGFTAQLTAVMVDLANIKERSDGHHQHIERVKAHLSDPDIHLSPDERSRVRAQLMLQAEQRRFAVTGGLQGRYALYISAVSLLAAVVTMAKIVGWL